MKLIKALFLVLGFYILYVTVKAVGVGNILSYTLDLRWKLLPMFLVYPLVFFFDTLGWAYAFPRSLRNKASFLELYRTRVVGETLNAVIPWAASLGGEPVKAELLKRRQGIPLSESYASILIVHTTFWLSLNLFVILGIFLTFKTLPLSPLLWHSVLVFLFGLGLIAIFLIIGLHLGVFRKVHRLGETLKWWGEKSSEKRHRYLELDEHIKKFYSRNPRRFFLSVAFNFLGWLAGVLEAYWIISILDIPIGFREAWLIEALIQVLRIVTFFIPSSIGAQEGGIVLLFLQFGFESSVGLMFAVIRRLREILWIALGLLLWLFTEDRPALKTDKT
ncbi:MAG: flippase-like domain-containing protein [Candidatus Omnitrophica bacterium]|nr:flippase-like domain-containing protein [Candidatus Omnitrophota bacterium]